MGGVKRGSHMPGSRRRNRAVTGVPGILKSNTVVRGTVVRMG